MSAFLTLILLFQGKIHWDGNLWAHWNPESFKRFSISDILFACFLFLAFVIILYKFSKYIELFKPIISLNRKIPNRKVFLYCSISSFVIFSIFLIHYFPGVVLSDSLESLYQGASGAPYYNQHPVVYSFFAGQIVRIGALIYNYTLGFLLYSLIQMAIMSMVIGYFEMWLSKHNAPTWILILVWIYYCFSGIFSAYSVTMWKDPLFSCFLFLCMLKIYDIIRSPQLLKKTSSFAVFLLLIWLTAFFRTNGLYIVAGLALILIPLIKPSKMQSLILLANIIIIILIQGPGYRACGIVTPIKESLGIPIQQIAYIMCNNGNVSKEEKEYLNTIIPLDDWTDSYTPFLVDTLKWQANGNIIEADKTRFIKTWSNIIARNLPLAIQAYALETYGFWSIGTNCDYGFYETYLVKPNIYNVAQTNKAEELIGINLRSLYSNMHFMGAGTLFVLMLFSFFCLMIRNRKYSLSLLPAALCWLTVMLATPVAFSLRYVFILAIACPYFVIIPFIDSRNSAD